MEITLPNNWQPRPYQLEAWKYLERGGRHAEIVWHRRAGKDELALHWTACAAFLRVATYWYMLPEYSQARKAIWDAINPHTGKKRIDEAFPKALRKTTRNHEMIIEFLNGSTFQVVGSDNPNSLVGSPPAGIVYSEWALSNPASRAYLRPIIMENGGWQIFNTTPRGRNHAHRTLLAAQNDPKAFGQVLDATQTKIYSEQQLEEELQAYINDFGEDYGRSKFEQEYLCSFDAANLGAILARQITIAERDGRISDEVHFDPLGQPIEISADIGRHDTSTWYFWQPQMGGYQIIDHDSGFGLDADEWCDRLQLRLGQYKNQDGDVHLGKIWLPHDAKAETFSAKLSAIETFINRFGMNRVALTPDSKKADRVNAARLLIPQIKFNKTKCAKGLEALRSWSYEWKDESKMFSSEPLHDWASHDGDGFSYGCLIMQTYQPPKPKEPIRYYAQGTADGTIQTATIDELWESTPKRRNRI